MSASKRKGTAWERRIVDYLVDNGFAYAERRALEGCNDRGDIAGIPGVVIECKNARQLRLAEWVDEMVVEKKNAHAFIGAVIFPRRNHAIRRAYVVMEMEQFVQMIGD
jgi:Holliday junction resolvase